MLIEAKQLERHFGNHCAVNGLSFSLDTGQVLGFLGPNGAGKTTTMQMLCGNLAPHHGSIAINGIDLMQSPLEAKRFLGYLPDTPPLYRELTVHEYLSFCAGLHGILKEKKRQIMRTALERCNLMEVADRLIANLSKGYQQRVGIAQAILHDPDIIILDEPTTGLDPIQMREIRNLVAELASHHGIILSTHALTEVQESCTHVQIIDQGKQVLYETISGLEKRMRTASLKIQTRLAIDLKLLEQIPGVDEIERLAENQFRIHHPIEHNPAEQIAQTVIVKGWGLLELIPEKKTIEEVFVSLTDHPGTQ